MDVLILYDSTATNDEGVNRLALLLEVMDSNINVQTVALDWKKFKPCAGCFGCWVKTPGKCVITKDEANDNSRKLVNADTVILLSRVTYGGYSPDTKAFLDRFICNISPFFMIKSHEMHHQKRYTKYPDLVSFGYGDMTEQEKKTFLELCERNALNLHSRRHAAFTVCNPIEGMQAAIGLREFFGKEVVSK